ncbi:MFS transporter [Glaciihabitans sp. UYNi722]|uniref:MFS transporter n=1 Tax=Glaciihabitans sp. UYNi722 TaxID=3156344 RepID=UPI003393E512
MSDSRPLPLWAGRTVALVGILLVALNLRTAVAVISPIVSEIDVDIHLDSVELGVLGAVPPIAFALSALFGALIAKRVGLERLLVLALLAMIGGQLLRSVSANYAVLLIGSLIALVGAGTGNVLLPPIVKRYFPDRIGLITSLYVTLLSIGTAVTAALTAPIADSVGWRMSLAVWSIMALVALVPWVTVLLRHRRERAAALLDHAPEIEEPPVDAIGRIWHSKTAWTIAVVFALSSFHAYSAFAWLPQLLIDLTGVTPVQAGALLGLYSVIGLPAALIIPLLTARLRNVGWVIQSGIAFFVLGYLGLLFAPTAVPWLWVVLIGAGPLLFPAALTLINLRSRTHEGSVALSGFVQTIGYTLGALGPLLVALLHGLTGGWTGALILLIVTALAVTIPASRLAKPTYVEDDMARL